MVKTCNLSAIMPKIRLWNGPVIDLQFISGLGDAKFQNLTPPSEYIISSVTTTVEWNGERSVIKN